MPHCGFLTCDGPDEVERCSCDESLALRRELDAERARTRAAMIEALELAIARGSARRVALARAWGEGGNGLD